MAVRVVVVGNVVIVADIGTYLVSIIVTIVCIICSLLHHCIGVGVLMMFFHPRAICSISFSWCIFFIFQYRVVVFCLCDMLLKCVYLDRLCWPWSM